jgi:hypothetical protein
VAQPLSEQLEKRRIKPKFEFKNIKGFTRILGSPRNKHNVWDIDKNGERCAHGAAQEKPWCGAEEKTPRRAAYAA